MAKLLATVERAISPERLLPYRSQTGNNLATAIALYKWNAAISAALWLDIGHLEVLVRNAMHTQLTQWSTRKYREPRWYLNPGGVLGTTALADIASAHSRLSRANKPNDPGRVVAELNFGFWRYLAASTYDRALWKPALIHGFPGQARRRHVHNRLAHLHELRNRIGHWEPIHHVPLAQRHHELLTIIEWIDPDLRGWVEQQSTVPAMLSARPAVV